MHGVGLKLGSSENPSELGFSLAQSEVGNSFADFSSSEVDIRVADFLGSEVSILGANLLATLLLESVF